MKSLILLAGAVALFFFGKAHPSGPRTVATVAGREYRFFLTATPKLADADVAKIQAALTLAGAINFIVSQESSATSIQYDTNNVPNQSFVLGSAITIGGVTLTLTNIEEQVS